MAVHWLQLLSLRIIGDIADAIAMPALLAITASPGGDKPGKFFGILRRRQGLSFVIGPALGGALSFVSLRSLFLVDGISSLKGPPGCDFEGQNGGRFLEATALTGTT